MRLAQEIAQEVRFHRKQWEYIYILRALEQHGKLGERGSGIGFGCGKEPLAAALAKRGAKVIVTDIPPQQGSDAHWGSTDAMDLFYGGICSLEEYRRQVSFRPVNMNKIPDDLREFDFAWSCCALEHLGSLRAGIEFILHSAKCLKPGGIAVHTTELNVRSETETIETDGLSVYRRRDFLDLQTECIERGLELLPLNFYFGTLPEDQYVDLPPYKQETHLKLAIEKFVITSFGLVVRRGKELTMRRTDR